MKTSPTPTGFSSQRFELDPSGKAPLPVEGVMVGLFPGNEDNGVAAEAATGIKPAVLMRYFYFPRLLDAGSEENSNFLLFLEHCIGAKQIPMITLETIGGLESYAAAQVAQLG